MLQVQQGHAQQWPIWGSHPGSYRQARRAQTLGHRGQVSNIAARLGPVGTEHTHNAGLIAQTHLDMCPGLLHLGQKIDAQGMARWSVCAPAFTHALPANLHTGPRPRDALCHR